MKRTVVGLLAALFLMCAGTAAYAIRDDGDDTEAYGEDLVFFLDQNDFIGVLSLSINGNICTGQHLLLWRHTGESTDEVSDVLNCSLINYPDGNSYIEFTRGDTGQVMHGYISSRRMSVAGYFEAGGQNYPWGGVSLDFLEALMQGYVPDTGNLLLVNDSIGAINISGVNGGDCAGDLSLSYNAEGNPLNEYDAFENCAYYSGGDNNDYMEFSLPTYNQTYYGWISWNQTTLAGYYAQDGMHYPFLAIDSEFLWQIIDRFAEMEDTGEISDPGYGMAPVDPPEEDYPAPGYDEEPPFKKYPAPGYGEEPVEPPDEYYPEPEPGVETSWGDAQIKNASTGRVYADFKTALDEIQSGQTLSIGPGDVYLPSPVFVYEKSNITIVGAGHDKTRIFMANPNSVVLSMGTGSNIIIRDLFLSHDVPPEEGCSAGVLEFFDIENLTIENSELVGSGVLGIMLWGVTGRVRIVNNIIRDNQTTGITINGGEDRNMSDFVLQGNTIKNNGTYAVACEYECEALDSIRVVASNNVMANNGGGDVNGLPPRFQKAVKDSKVKGYGGN